MLVLNIRLRVLSEPESSLKELAINAGQYVKIAWQISELDLEMSIHWKIS